MSLRQFEYALAVAEQGSVTAAAEVLRVAQPSMSQQIRGLERDLGVELFDRTPFDRLCRRGVLGLALMAACEQSPDDAHYLGSGVEITPGLTAFTRTPRGASSIASEGTIVSRAPCCLRRRSRPRAHEWPRCRR